MATAAEEYGYHMGLAFQIIDDILDIVGAADVSFCTTLQAWLDLEGWCASFVHRST